MDPREGAGNRKIHDMIIRIWRGFTARGCCSLFKESCCPFRSGGTRCPGWNLPGSKRKPLVGFTHCGTTRIIRRIRILWKRSSVCRMTSVLSSPSWPVIFACFSVCWPKPTLCGVGSPSSLVFQWYLPHPSTKVWRTHWDSWWPRGPHSSSWPTFPPQTMALPYPWGGRSSPSCFLAVSYGNVWRWWTYRSSSWGDAWSSCNQVWTRQKARRPSYFIMFKTANFNVNKDPRQ